MAKRGNGEGSICKRPDGRWQGCVTLGRNDNGRLLRKYFYGKTRKDVADKINHALEDIHNNKFIYAKNNPTVSEWCTDWLWNYKRNAIKSKTFDQYETILRVHVIPNIGNIRLVGLKTHHVQRIINNMHDSGLSRRTIELMKIILHAALKQAQRNGLVNDNICENVSLPRKTQKNIRVLNNNEQEKLIDALQNNYICRGLLFALYTGMRRGEVLALKWSDYNREEKTISVTKALSRVRTYSDNGEKTKLEVDTPKTNTSIRVIPLIDKAVALLDLHKKLQTEYKNLVGNYYEDNNLIFSNSSGGYIDPGNFNRKLNKISTSLGIDKLSPHALRHSFATRGLEADISLKAMQELLGHSSITITGDIYTHILKEQKRKEVSKLNRVF